MGESMFTLDGFVTHRLGRQYLNAKGEVKRGGGLATIIQNEIRHEVMHEEELDIMSEDLELLTLKVSLPFTRKIFVLNTHRPPSGDIDIFSTYN